MGFPFDQADTPCTIERPALLRSDDVWVQPEPPLGSLRTSVSFAGIRTLWRSAWDWGFQVTSTGFTLARRKHTVWAMYLRFVVADIDEDSGWELGVFQAIRNLRMREKLHNFDNWNPIGGPSCSLRMTDLGRFVTELIQQ